MSTNYLVEETFESFNTESLDDLAADHIDAQVFQTTIVQNVGRQPISLIIANSPSTPFVRSTGIVTILPGGKVQAETTRMDPAQLQQLRNSLLVRTTVQNIVLTR